MVEPKIDLNPKVAVVILNYNGMKNSYLERFLPSVYASTYANMDLYVIDNASTDDSVAYLQKQGFQPLNTTTGNKFLIQLDQNYWFAGGYNKGLALIKNADYFVLLNSDVKVAPDWIEPCISLLEANPQVAACQPKIKMESEPHLFEHAGAAGGWMDEFGYPFCRGRVFMDLEEDSGQYDDVTEIFWASGAAFFVRASLFSEIGGFDEGFQAHMEEIDLCWRLKRANFQIMVCPQSVVWHVGGGTLPASNPHKTYLNFRNSLITVYKNEIGLKAFWIVWIRLLLDGVAGVRFLMKGEWANIAAIVKAHWFFFMNFSTIKQRKKIDSSNVSTVAFGQKTQFNQTGQLSKSIVWQYFVKGKKTFQDLT